MSGTGTVTVESTVARLRELLGEVLEMDGAAVDPDVPVTAYGVDSRTGMVILTDLEAWAGVRLDPDIFSARPSLAEIAVDVVTAVSERGAR